MDADLLAAADRFFDLPDGTVRRIVASRDRRRLAAIGLVPGDAERQLRDLLGRA